jgi:hypothetical protein
MIGNIYYIIGIIMLIRLTYMIVNFKKIHSLREWLIKFKEISGKIPTKKDFRDKEEVSLYETNTVMMLFELLWLLCGLFSGNQIIFLGLIVYFILLKLITKKIGFTLLDKILMFLNILIRFGIYFWMIINHFIN